MMKKTTTLRIPLVEPIALLDATLLFIIQLFLAQHPQLLAPPESHRARPPPALRNARRVLDAVRDLHDALLSYGALLSDAAPIPPGSDDAAGADDIPF